MSSECLYLSIIFRHLIVLDIIRKLQNVQLYFVPEEQLVLQQGIVQYLKEHRQTAQ